MIVLKNEVENNWLPMHTKYFIQNKIASSAVQKLSKKQSAEVIFRFDRPRTAHSKRQTSYVSTGNLIGFPCIWLHSAKVNPSLISCEDLATAPPALGGSGGMPPQGNFEKITHFKIESEDTFSNLSTFNWCSCRHMQVHKTSYLHAYPCLVVLQKLLYIKIVYAITS